MAHAFITDAVDCVVVLRQVHSLSLPRRILHTTRSSASYFKLQYLFFSLRSSSRCLRILPLPPFTVPRLFL